MKLKLIALFLALTMMSWAQSTTQTPAPEQKSTPADVKASCPCCEKMASADHKEGHACMHQGATGKDDKGTMSCCSGKDAASCCAGKDGKSCAKNAQASASCCQDSKDGQGHEMACCAGKDGKSCAKNAQASASCCQDSKDGQGHEMACCSDKDGKQMTHDCCGGNQCGKGAHHDHAAPGN